MVELAEPLAKSGFREMQICLGRAYRDGKGVTKDLVKSAEWMRKAVNQDAEWVKWELFDILWRIGTEESYVEMIGLAEPLAESGNRDMQVRMGRAYRDGKGVPKDLNKAAYWMRNAVRQGVKCSNWELFDILWRIGTEGSYAEMVELAEPLAKSGFREMQICLGRSYRDGKGVPKDLNMAAYWMRKAVNQNAEWVKWELFDILWGIGTEESYAEMVELAEPLAESGDRDMQVRMGRAYRDGKGVPKDLNKAAYWMRKALKQKVDAVSLELSKILEQIGD